MKTYNPLRLAQAVLCRLLEQQHIPTAAADKPDGQDIKAAKWRRRESGWTGGGQNEHERCEKIATTSPDTTQSKHKPVSSKLIHQDK